MTDHDTVVPEEVPVEVRSVTNSELQSFKHCRREWYLSYHLRLTPRRRRPVGPLHLGSRVHVALEALGHEEDPLAAYDAAVEADRPALAAVVAWNEEQGYSSDELLKTFESEAVLGRLMVAGFVDWLAETGADQGYEVLGVEEKVSAYLGVRTHDGRPVHLLGKQDVKLRRVLDGAVLFLDHKTCQNLADFLSWAHLNEQFLTYQTLDRLHRDATGSDVPLATGALVNLLRKVKRTAQAKPPFYAREEVHHNATELEAFWLKLHGVVRDLLQVEHHLARGTDHRLVAYPTPSRDCTWRCDFFSVCQMLDDGSDAERFLRDHFERYDPLSRYDTEGHTS